MERRLMQVQVDTRADEVVDDIITADEATKDGLLDVLFRRRR